MYNSSAAAVKQDRFKTFLTEMEQQPESEWKPIISSAYYAKIFGLDAAQFINTVWTMTESWEQDDKEEIQSVLTDWEIENNAFLGRTLFQNRIKLHFIDPQKQRALDAYKNRDLDGCVGFLRKGIDGFITTTAASKKDGLPYRVLVLEELDAGPDYLMLLGARLAAGSPRVYVEYDGKDGLEAIRVSIDPYRPKILGEDEKDCPGADFTDIYDFIRKCHQHLINHWNGKINSSELRRRVHKIMEGQTKN